MFIYVVLLLITAIIYIACLTINNIYKRRKWFLYLSSIPLILTMGMRDMYVGTDAIQYYNAFNNINTSNYGWFDYKQTRYEVGYYLLNKIIGLFTKDPQVFLFLTSIIIVAGIFIFIYKNSKNPFISVLLFQTLYFYCNSFNLLREYIAIAIAINSISFIKEKKLFKSITIIILAGTFHTSAYCLFPIAILLCTFKINRLNIKRYLLGLTVLCIFVPFIIQISIKMFPRYQFYLTYSSTYNGGKVMPYIYICMVIVGLIIISKLKIKDLKENNYYTFSVYVFIAALLGIISNLYFESASRIMEYFSIYLIVFIPEFLNLFPRREDRLVIHFGLIISTLIYYNMLLHNGVAGVYPYIFLKN
jgi:hypothetical protein